MSEQALEIVRFTVTPGEEEALVAGRDRMLGALRSSFDGMLSASLGRLDDGTWIDVIVWESRAKAEAAAAGAPAVPEVGAWFAHIGEIRSMEHATIPAATPADPA